MSSRDAAQAEWLQSRGVTIPAPMLDPTSAGAEDLCARLVAAGALDAERAAYARAAAERSQAERRSALTEEVGRELARDPLFTPHAESAFARGERLGEGGMGVVFAIRDRRLDRDAALKLLKTDDERTRRRFLREARLTAQLAHPAIPPVYEVGTLSDGRVYLLLKRIEGETLEARLEALAGDRSASVDDLLEILIRVAEAVAFAHSRGVIHRDLKPQNIMIGAFGEVMVMDWGLARDLNDEREDPESMALSTESLDLGRLARDAGLTLAEGLLGTPGYMAPEQIDGHSSLHSDVFALGCLLTEILTGRRANGDGQTLERMARTAGGSTARPRELDPGIPRELDVLANAALSLTPEERPSAAEFAAELRRYQTGQPLRLVTYRRTERLRRAIAARPAWTVGVALSLLFAISLVAVNRGAAAARRERSMAVLAKRLAEATRARAELERKRAEDLQARAEQERAEAVHGRQRAVESQRLLEKARSLTRRGAHPKLIRETLARSRELGDDRYEIRLACAEILWRAGLPEESTALLEAAARDSPPAYEALFALHRQTVEAQAAAERSWSSPWLKKLVERAWKRGVVNEFTLYSEASALSDKGRHREALPLYTRAIEEYAPSFALALGDRGWTYKQLGELEKALPDLNEALKLRPELVGSRLTRGNLLIELGRVDEALADLEKAASLAPGLYKIQSSLGSALEKAGHLREALVAHRRATKLAPESAVCWNNRSNTEEGLGLWKDAMRSIDRAVKLQPGNPLMVMNRADLLRALGRRQEALTEIDRSLAIDPDSASAWNIRGVIQLELGRIEAAIEDLRRSARLDPDAALPQCNLGNALVKLGRMEEALVVYAKAATLAPASQSVQLNHAALLFKSGRPEAGIKVLDRWLANHPRDTKALGYRGLFREKSGARDAALADYRRALELAPQSKEAPTLRKSIKRLEASRKR